jgi:hypothetical protein
MLEYRQKGKFCSHPKFAFLHRKKEQNLKNSEANLFRAYEIENNTNFTTKDG